MSLPTRWPQGPRRVLLSNPCVRRALRGFAFGGANVFLFTAVRPTLSFAPAAARAAPFLSGRHRPSCGLSCAWPPLNPHLSPTSPLPFLSAKRLRSTDSMRDLGPACFPPTHLATCSPSRLIPLMCLLSACTHMYGWIPLSLPFVETGARRARKDSGKRAAGRAVALPPTHTSPSPPPPPLAS